MVTLSTKDNQNHQNSLAKGLKDQFTEMNMKQKLRIKMRQISIDLFFLISIFVGVNGLLLLIYLSRDKKVKRFKTQRYH